MADVLIAALSAPGRIGPLLSVAENLVARGDRVTVMTGAAHANAVQALGARHRALPADAEADDSCTELGSRRG